MVRSLPVIGGRLIRLDTGFDEGVTHGPLIHAAAVQKTEDHVEDAKKKGASVVSGGKRMEGNYFVRNSIYSRSELSLSNSNRPS